MATKNTARKRAGHMTRWRFVLIAFVRRPTNRRVAHTFKSSFWLNPLQSVFREKMSSMQVGASVQALFVPPSLLAERTLSNPVSQRYFREVQILKNVYWSEAQITYDDGNSCVPGLGIAGMGSAQSSNSASLVRGWPFRAGRVCTSITRRSDYSRLRKKCDSGTYPWGGHGLHASRRSEAIAVRSRRLQFQRYWRLGQE